MSSTSINRSGTRAASERFEEMLDTQDLTINDEPRRGPTDTELRQSAIEEAESVGSPTDIPVDAALAPLLDALGGRLAYERSGARLYDAILRKATTIGHLWGLEEMIPDLEHIRDEEVAHAQLLMRVISELDGDPTLETPTADIDGVMSSGLLQVVHDPRTSLLACLRTAVVAELADIENWTALTAKVRGQISDELAEEITTALAEENEHLALVRKWVAVADAPVKATQQHR